jgi:hypothetical protein
LIYNVVYRIFTACVYSTVKRRSFVGIIRDRRKLSLNCISLVVAKRTYIALLIADKLEELMRVQVDAVKNIKIDKVTVWDGGQNADGKTSTANFISGMMKSVPPLDEVFALSGMQLPSFLGKKAEENADEPKVE